MKYAQLSVFENIDFPKRDISALTEEVSAFETWVIPEIVLDLQHSELPIAARNSLERHFTVASGGIEVETILDPALKPEEFILECKEDSIRITAKDDSGLRYGVCELEDRLRNREHGVFRQAPAIPRRISRCFFAPTSRPPLKLDELTDDFDYYPDAYLDRIMHDRLNGVWLTLYLNDMPCSFFPERGEKADIILKKLQKVADKCALYGIKCYIFMAEPRVFADDVWKSGSTNDLARHPELGGHKSGDTAAFCTSAPAGKQYLQETIGYIFSHVQGLGGLINIMCIEDAVPCALWKLYDHVQHCNCALCSQRSAAELFSEIASIMANTVKKYQPDAEFFGWFYEPIHFKNDPEQFLRLEIARMWPDNAQMIHNIETGGNNCQLGRNHTVHDYSLSYAGPSEYFLKLAAERPTFAAKMQTGCSHENASVPYIPVPGILFQRYKNLRQVNCCAVMQCWYFGSAPGIMNRAAGRLSFDPMPKNEDDFLLELAKPLWGKNAHLAASAWQKLGEGYQYFPENLLFKWFGPMHNAVVTPWYLYPVDTPVAPSYTQAFPKNSGDRYGEYFGYEHTPNEIRLLTRLMATPMRKSVSLIRQAAITPEQQKEAGVIETIAIQTASMQRLFEFYQAREEMIYLGKDNKSFIHQLITDEITDTFRLAELCEKDSRLGYHAEVESFLFFPEKLRARANLLKECDSLIDTFNLNADILKEYRGETGKYYLLYPKENASAFNLDGSCGSFYSDANKFIVDIDRFSQPVRVEFEPFRMMQIIDFKVSSDRHDHNVDLINGVEIIHTNRKTQIFFDLDYFSRWRIDDTAPYRFNLSSGKDSLHPIVSQPSRLLLGTANTADLVLLKKI